MPRHFLATPCPAAWAALLASRPDLAEDLLGNWAAQGWPLVQRRPMDTDPPGEVPLGLPLPPAHGKRRIAVSLKQQGLLSLSPPPLLAECRHAAPAHWQATISELLALDAGARCFGSLAWQHLTGLAYLSEHSDLDLLWNLPTAAGLAPLLTGLSRIAATAPMRIDGEILSGQGAVHWRELVQPGVLAVKTESGVALMPRAEFLGQSA